MRCYIPLTILILFGVFVSDGNCRQITSLPPMTAPDRESSQVEPQFTNQPVLQSANPVVPGERVAGHGKLNDVFENALSQFPQHRTARLPVTRQEPATFIETPQFQSRPTAFSAPVRQPTNNTVFQQLPLPNQFQQASATLQQGDFDINGAELDSVRPAIVESVELEQSFAPMQSLPEQRLPQLGIANQWTAPATGAIASLPTNQYPLAPTTALPTENGFVVSDDQSITWWKSRVMQSIDGTRATETVDSNQLVYQTLQNSPRIQAVSQNPLIRELQIVEADAEFDATQYVRSQFEDRVDPVGNSLTVGLGENFLKDNIWSADLGLRKKARNGASWELNQRLGFQNSNSNFFVPQDQGTATLALNVTQPLLRGRGKYYNQSQILIAQSINGAAWQTFHAELQDELLGVVSAYWDLYLNRSVYLQKKRNVERGQKVLDRLEGRAGLDSLPSQIARARSSVQTRRTELANALRDIRNAETEVRRLTADNSWMNGGGSELIPGELPTAATFQLPLEQVVYEALQHRPEIHEALDRARIASVQRDVSVNELMPELSLLLGSYVSALRGDTGIANAFQDQFGQVKPGYSVGINFEVPYGNRAARSRLAQRKLQVKKIKHEVDEVMQSVIAESQVALRRVESASETLVAATEAIRAAHADRDQFERRWESFALVEGDLADGQNPTTVLDQLLDSQDRLASAELVYVQAERELKVSEVALQRAMGTLLMRQNVSTSRAIDCDMPRMEIFKDGSPMSQGSMEVPSDVIQPSMTVAPTGFIGQPK